MENLQIKKTDFEKAKKDLQVFSRTLPPKIQFEEVGVDGGLFGLGDHKVTGAEMNKFIGEVQNILVKLNNFQIKIIKEFGDVYNTFDLLDQEYINGIILSVKSAEEASQQALRAQNDISSTVKNLKKAVTKLIDLKDDVYTVGAQVETLSNELESYDTVVQRLKVQYAQCEDQYQTTIDKVKKITVKLDEIHKIIENQKPLRNELISLLSQVKGQKHFNAIDNIWNNVEQHKTQLYEIREQLDSIRESISKSTVSINQQLDYITSFHNSLRRYSHLNDIDTIWSDLEGCKARLDKTHEEVKVQIDSYTSDTNSMLKDTQCKLRNLEEKSEERDLVLNKKIKLAYGLSGCAFAVIIIQLILQILGVL